MDLQVKVHLEYAVPQPSDLLLQIEAAQDSAQKVSNESLNLYSEQVVHRVGGNDTIGQRFWLPAATQFKCDYEARVTVRRTSLDLQSLKQAPLHLLPADVIKYLMASRYCHTDQFLEFTSAAFGTLSGGELIAAMVDWIATNLSYVRGSSNAQTTAHETLAARKGVCRDYAHVLIAMARAVAIPARFVSAYAPNVTPQDFHAVAEVYLEGGWHLIDATHMAKAENIIRIGVGRDAADVSFLTSYGAVELRNQKIEVIRL